MNQKYTTVLILLVMSCAWHSRNYAGPLSSIANRLEANIEKAGKRVTSDISKKVKQLAGMADAKIKSLYEKAKQKLAQGLPLTEEEKEVFDVVQAAEQTDTSKNEVEALLSEDDDELIDLEDLFEEEKTPSECEELRRKMNKTPAFGITSKDGKLFRREYEEKCLNKSE